MANARTRRTEIMNKYFTDGGKTDQRRDARHAVSCQPTGNRNGYSVTAGVRGGYSRHPPRLRDPSRVPRSDSPDCLPSQRG